MVLAVSDGLRPIEEYPDISYIENYTVEKLADEMIEWFKTKRTELTGEDIVLGKADDRRIILLTGAYFIFQGYMYLDNAGKMGLLKYSHSDFLENLGALKHIYRKDATGATTTIRFSLLEARETTTSIPQGTRLTAGDSVFFATDEYGEILPGETYVDLGATCLTAGSAGNNYDIGDIKTMVDPVLHIDSVANTTKPENGADIEGDGPLKQRIYIAPSAYSSAGPEDAWEYYVREFYPAVTDVRVTNPSPRVVRIRYLVGSGEVPGEESINELAGYLSQPSIKPLTDVVEVLPPDVVGFSVNFRYYINKSDQSRANVIQSNVLAAVGTYQTWQRAKLGRDINPFELLKLVMQAGAKRVEITSPVYTVIGAEAVAISTTGAADAAIYGGLEDD